MVIRAGREVITIEIYKEIHDSYLSRARAENPTSKPQIKHIINENLLMNLEKYEMLKKYAPYLSKVGMQDDTLFIKDSKNNSIVEVRMKGGKLVASNKNPIYVQFALALPEIVRLQKNT